MKKLLFFVTVILIGGTFHSCQTEEIIPELENQEVVFEFSKEMTISDRDGNTVDLMIYAHNQESLDDQTEDVIVLKTYTQKFNVTSNANATIEDIEDDLDVAEDIFIQATNFDFNDNVTGFSIRSLLENNEYKKKSISQHYVLPLCLWS